MRLFLCLPLLAAIPGIAFAGPLTFDAALQRARQEAPSLKAKALGADAARSARRAAGALPDPTLAVGNDAGRGRIGRRAPGADPCRAPSRRRDAGSPQ